MVFFLIKKFKSKIKVSDEKTKFLIFTVIIPILLIFFTSMIMGAKIRTMWMTPFYLYLGVLIVHFFQKDILKRNLTKFITIFIIFFLLSPLTYLIVSVSQDNKRTDYPGKEIAYLVQNKWNQNFKNEIKFVIGDEWSAGNLSYHLDSRPSWILDLKDKASTLDINGGVIYAGNPQILKEICPGVFGTIKPVGYCMIGQK